MAVSQFRTLPPSSEPAHQQPMEVDFKLPNVRSVTPDTAPTITSPGSGPERRSPALSKGSLKGVSPGSSSSSGEKRSPAESEIDLEIAEEQGGHENKLGFKDAARLIDGAVINSDMEVTPLFSSST